MINSSSWKFLASLPSAWSTSCHFCNYQKHVTVSSEKCLTISSINGTKIIIEIKIFFFSFSEVDESSHKQTRVLSRSFAAVLRILIFNYTFPSGWRRRLLWADNLEELHFQRLNDIKSAFKFNCIQSTFHGSIEASIASWLDFTVHGQINFSIGFD